MAEDFYDDDTSETNAYNTIDISDIDTFDADKHWKRLTFSRIHHGKKFKFPSKKNNSIVEAQLNASNQHIIIQQLIDTTLISKISIEFTIENHVSNSIIGLISYPLQYTMHEDMDTDSDDINPQSLGLYGDKPLEHSLFKESYYAVGTSESAENEFFVWTPSRTQKKRLTMDFGFKSGDTLIMVIDCNERECKVYVNQINEEYLICNSLKKQLYTFKDIPQRFLVLYGAHAIDTDDIDDDVEDTEIEVRLLQLVAKERQNKDIKKKKAHEHQRSSSFDFYIDIEDNDDKEDDYEEDADDTEDHVDIIARHRRNKKRNSSKKQLNVAEDERQRSKSVHGHDEKKHKKGSKKRKKKRNKHNKKEIESVDIEADIDESNAIKDDVDVDIDIDIGDYDWTAFGSKDVSEASDIEEELDDEYASFRRSKKKHHHKKKKKKKKRRSSEQDTPTDKKLKKRKYKKHKKRGSATEDDDSDNESKHKRKKKKKRHHHHHHHKRRHSHDGSHTLEERASKERRKKRRKKRSKHSHQHNANGLQHITEQETITDDDDEKEHKRRHSHDGSNKLQVSAQTHNRSHSHDESNTLEERAQREHIRKKDEEQKGRRYLHHGYRSRPDVVTPTSPNLSPRTPGSPESVSLRSSKSLRSPRSPYLTPSEYSDDDDDDDNDEQYLMARMELRRTKSLPPEAEGLDKPLPPRSPPPSQYLSRAHHALDAFETKRRAADECYLIDKCLALKRIKMLLQFYQKILNQMHHKDDIIAVYCSKYQHFLNDYHHIMMVHLNGGKKENDAKFALIYERMDIKCDITKCNSFVRNNSSNDSYIARSDRRLNFYIGILDTIHCLFVHSYDGGFRLEPCDDDDDDLKEDDAFDESMNDDEVMVAAYTDTRLKRMNATLPAKCEFLSSIQGSERMKMNKWSNDFQRYRCKDDDETLFGYDFGQRFYYWPYYRNNEDEDRLYNAGSKYCEWYIAAKYSTLKEEVLDNALYSLDKKQYLFSCFCAQQFMDTNYVCCHLKQESERYDSAMVDTKDIICSRQRMDELHYGISAYAPITMSHILSIVLFCDYIELRTCFVSTFKRLRDCDESDIHFKCRHGEFHHFAKYLRESVEIYGEWISSSSDDEFYCFIGHKVMLTPLSSNINVPLSTSTELSVLSLYSHAQCCDDGGFVFSMRHNSRSPHALFLKYFNVSLLSSSCFECERLFIGGWAPITFYSIFSVSNNDNYSCFLRAISIFLSGVSGANVKHKISSILYVVLDKLIRYELNLNSNIDRKLYPIYPTELFHFVCANLSIIKMNVSNMNRCYPKLQKYFVSPTTHMPLFEYLMKLCPKCVEIEIEMMNSNNTISASFLAALAPIIERLNENTKLETIRFRNIRNRCNDKELKKFKSSMPSISSKSSKSAKSAKSWSINIITSMSSNKANYKYKYQYDITKNTKAQSSLMHKMKKIFGQRLQSK